jgi:hypothetical protein
MLDKSSGHMVRRPRGTEKDGGLMSVFEKQGSKFIVSTNSPDPPLMPQVTALSGGGLGMTWMAGEAEPRMHYNGLSARAQIYDADGAKIGSELQVELTSDREVSLVDVTGLADGAASPSPGPIKGLADRSA